MEHEQREALKKAGLHAATQMAAVYNLTDPGDYGRISFDIVDGTPVNIHVLNSFRAAKVTEATERQSA